MNRRSARVFVALSVFLVVMAFFPGALSRGVAAAGRFPVVGHHPAPAAVSKNTHRKPRMQAQRPAAAFSSAAVRLSQSGVTCEDETPPDAIQACAGKNVGDTCTAGHEEHSFTGRCALIPGGVLACQPPPPPPPSQGAIDACAGKAPGDSCLFPTEDSSSAGLCKAFGTGVVACVRAPVSLLAAVDACTGKAAGDACTFAADEDDAVTGACTSIPDLGTALVCVPSGHIPPAVVACDGKSAGDACSFEHDGDAFDGTCVLPAGQTVLVCQPDIAPVIDACAGKSGGDACTFIHDDETVEGTCTAVMGMLACVPDRLIPPAVAACSDLSAGDACTFARDDRTVNGNCAAVPDHDFLVCVPPPPQALIDACIGKVAGDLCSALLGDYQFSGVCAMALDGVTLACLPNPHHDGDGEGDDDQGEDDQGDGHSARVAACQGLPAGALCFVTVGNKTQNGTCRLGDDDDSDALACLPPAPPQEAVDACTGLVSGDSCSFAWHGVTVSGTCGPLPGGATLVCAPLCPHPQNHRRD